MHERKLVPRIVAHVSNGSPDCPLSPSGSGKIWLPSRHEPRGRTAIHAPSAAGLGATQTWPFLQHGVPTGAVSALPQWPAKKPETAVPPDLEICEGNWKMALRNEIANNWIVETGLSIAEARAKLRLGIAIGKLHVVFSRRKEPRLVLDSTVCQVNTRCHLPERLSLPMASDLALSTQPEDTLGAFVGAIDFKAARKQVQVRPQKHGLLLFAFEGKLYRYRACHFGGRFSAFWWQRTWAFGLEAPQSLPFRRRPSARTRPR